MVIYDNVGNLVMQSRNTTALTRGQILPATRHGGFQHKICSLLRYENMIRFFFGGWDSFLAMSLLLVSIMAMDLGLENLAETGCDIISQVGPRCRRRSRTNHRRKLGALRRLPLAMR